MYDFLESSMLDTKLKALADPTRREILSLLKTKPRRAGEIAAHFSISEAAVSRHLSVLKNCRMIAKTQAGRFVWYHLEPEELDDIVQWLREFI